MSTNITLKLDERLIRRVRHIAVNQNTSVSAWVADVIEANLKDRDRNSRSRREALAALRQGFSLGGKPLSRERLHER